MSDKDGMLMNDTMIEMIPNSSKVSNVILTRTLRKSKTPKNDRRDLQIMLKLRENRIRISHLANDFLNEEFNQELEILNDEEFIYNLKDINAILHNMRHDLKGIRR